jgi:hypothetical protein
VLADFERNHEGIQKALAELKVKMQDTGHRVLTRVADHIGGVIDEVRLPT